MSETTTQDGGEEVEQFWAGTPLTVRSDLYHVYDAETLRSLCGRYGHSSYNEKSPVKDDDTYTEGGDCKECARRAGVLEDGQ